MRKEMDKIQFESRSEIQNVMEMINKYVYQNPKEKRNETFIDDKKKPDILSGFFVLVS